MRMVRPNIPFNMPQLVKGRLQSDGIIVGLKQGEEEFESVPLVLLSVGTCYLLGFSS